MKTINLRKVIVVSIIALVLVIEYFNDNVGIPCIFHELTGWYCPGCGITRALISILQLNFYQAFRYNMLVVILLPFAIFYWIYRYIFKGKRNIPNTLWIILLILVILFGILRNISIFSYLAPTIL